MKDTQNLRISLSDFPLGSKSAPPLPPPMFTGGDTLAYEINVFQTTKIFLNWVMCENGQHPLGDPQSQRIVIDQLEVVRLSNFVAIRLVLNPKFEMLTFVPSALPLPHHPHQKKKSHVELTSSQSILEDLLKAQELQDAQIDGGMESETSLVRTESRVELDTIAAVDLWLSLIVLPDDTELDDTLGDGDDLQGSLVFRGAFRRGSCVRGSRRALWIVVSRLFYRKEGPLSQRLEVEDWRVRNGDWRLKIGG